MVLQKNIAITPDNDPWEAYQDRIEFGKPTLTNIELQQQRYAICVVSIAQLDIC
ncbi:hypothetical protein JCM19037_4546 [Geomicrobium sp. JCM 19037]|nr:hypothetical protein JCM19037_4546 [Geomicrobium sp. JCM 19037]